MKSKLLVWLLLFLLLPLAASAQDGFCGGEIGNCVSKIYIWAIGAAGILALLMLIFGGYMVMTAGGNAQRAATGKSFLVSSITGLVLLLGAYFLLNTINPDLTNFHIDFSGLNQTSPPAQ
ncbi:MAG: pilin [Candidatus Saccharibacteria bacterium]